MGLRQKILRVVAEDSGGPRNRNVLRALARTYKVADFDKTFDAMLERGELVMYGDKRGARYGLPRSRPVGGNKRRRAHVPPASNKRAAA